MNTNVQDDKILISNLRRILINQERTLREYEEHKYFFNSYKNFKQIFHDITSNAYIDNYFSSFFANNNLSVKLGAIKLGNDVSQYSKGKFNPVRIYRAYKLKRNKFDKLVKFIKSGERKEAERLILDTFHNRRDRGEALTLLSKETTDPAETAKYAYLAWLADSTPYRLKYWAFRAFDNKEYNNAYFLLSMTPEEIIRSASEKRYQKKISDKFNDIYREGFKNLVADLFTQYAK